MTTVSMRWQNVRVLLVALFVFGASSQALVCELACGLQMQPAGCHERALQASGAGHSVAIGMAHAHCSHAMGTSTEHTTAHDIRRCHQGSCNHSSIWALEKSRSVDVHFPAMQLAVVEVAPLGLTLPGNNVIAGKGPPYPLASADPLLVSLRV